MVQAWSAALQGKDFKGGSYLLATEPLKYPPRRRAESFHATEGQ